MPLLLHPPPPTPPIFSTWRWATVHIQLVHVHVIKIITSFTFIHHSSFLFVYTVNLYHDNIFAWLSKDMLFFSYHLSLCMAFASNLIHCIYSITYVHHYLLNWIELNWIELNWIELNWIELKLKLKWLWKN